MAGQKRSIIVIRHGEHNNCANQAHTLTKIGRNKIFSLGKKLQGRGYRRPRFVTSPAPQTNASARVLAQAFFGHSMTSIETSLVLRSREEDWYERIDDAVKFTAKILEEDLMFDSLILVTHNEFASELPPRLAKLLFGTSPKSSLHLQCGHGAILTTSGEIETIYP